MRKAITPIISIIVLLLITITLAGSGWNYLSGYYEGMTSKTIRVVYGSETGNEVSIMNTGTMDITQDDLMVMVDGKESAVMEMIPSTLEPKKSARIVFHVTGRDDIMDVKVMAPGNAISYEKTIVPEELTCPGSCLDTLNILATADDGSYYIDPDGPGGNSPVRTFCDMTTDGGGWTLVWVGTGKTYSDTLTDLNSIRLIDTYVTSIDRSDMSSGTSTHMQTKLIEKWPYYTEVYYERWLPGSLTGRSYASPGWAKWNAYTLSPTPTDMNFWSTSRTDTQGWIFSLGGACGSPPEPSAYWVCHEMPTGERQRHIWGCWGCASNYLWFQRVNSWNGFFPDRTYGYWRISDSADYHQQWPEYDALSEGAPMPGYGLYVR